MIPYEKLTEDQCQYICEHLIGVPESIDWTLEVLPAILYEEEEHRYEVRRYLEGEDVSMYLERFSDMWSYLLSKSMWCPENEGYKNKRLLTSITLRNPDVMDVNGAPIRESRYFDFQSCHPLHPESFDIFPYRFCHIFDHFIAPLALLTQETHHLPGLGLVDGVIPSKSEDKKTEQLVEVWNAMGGITYSHHPVHGTANVLDMGHWVWDKEKVTPEYWMHRVSEFFAWCRGKFGTQRFQEWRHVAHVFDEKLWNMSQDDVDDDDDEEEEEEDFDPIDDDYTPEEVEDMMKEEKEKLKETVSKIRAKRERSRISDALLDVLLCADGDVKLSPQQEARIDSVIEKLADELHSIIASLLPEEHHKEKNDAETKGNDAEKKKQ